MAARREAREAHQRGKLRRKTWRRRRDLLMRAGKTVKSAARKIRHRTAVTIYRALYITGLWRGELPGND
jgi:hypothetical protein